jgi:hypothetical protein
MTDDTKRATYTAFALQHGTRRWLQVGTARPEAGGMFRILLDRLPVGGFAGQILLTPKGETPPGAEPDDAEPDEEDEPLKH